MKVREMWSAKQDKVIGRAELGWEGQSAQRGALCCRIAPKWKWRDSANETASHYAELPPEGHIIADLMRGDIIHRHFWAMRPPALLLRYKSPQQESGLLKRLTGWAACSLQRPRFQGESRSSLFVFFFKSLIHKHPEEFRSTHLWYELQQQKHSTPIYWDMDTTTIPPLNSTTHSSLLK